MLEDIFDIPIEPVISDDADQTAKEDANSEFRRKQKRADKDEDSKDHPVNDFKPSLERVFFGVVHFLHS